jgi:hypothetical protein
MASYSLCYHNALGEGKVKLNYEIISALWLHILSVTTMNLAKAKLFLKTYGGVEVWPVVPRILNLGTRWK